MDNTTNGQNPPSPQPTQLPQNPAPSGTGPTVVTSPLSQQPPNTFVPQHQVPVPPITQPQPIAQAPSMPQAPTPPPPPVQPVQQEPSSPRITLEDLYGPSGFANTPPDASVQQPIPSPTSAVQQPMQQPVAEVPTPPSQETTTIPPETVTSMPQLPVVEANQTAEASAPQGLTPPSMPTSQEDQSTTLMTPEEKQPQPAEVPADLPTRSQRGEHGASVANPPEEKMKESVPVKNSSEPPPAEAPKKSVNRLNILRILFGIIAAGIALIVILFGITWASSLFHPAATGKVNLTFWGLWEDSNTMQVAISQFEQQNPTITVTYEKEDPKAYTQRLLTHIQQGDGPDIFTYHSSWLPLVQSDLVPLPTSVMSKSDLENSFYPVVKNDLVKNGALYGVPLEVDTLSLFVNNSLFKSAKASVPTTWDTFSSTARALTQKDANGKIKIAGAAMGTFANITHAPDILSALFLQNGVDMTKLAPKNNVSDALSFYTSFASGDSSVWDSTLDPSQLAFAKGNLAMYFGYSWDVFAIKAANPSLDFSVYSIPHLPGRNTTAASYWVQGASAKSTHQKEALLFMHFLAQKNTEATLFAEEAKTRLFGEPYARSDLGATVKSNPLLYPFVAQATDASSSFFAGETFDTSLNGQMNVYLGNAVNSILNNSSADSAVDTLTKGVGQVLSQYASN